MKRNRVPLLHSVLAIIKIFFHTIE
uniref:Uncharacterized protein n=1 Tax=Arundo donax TaxID=35708 RepID=A0A0A8ZXI8_ARUDO